MSPSWEMSASLWLSALLSQAQPHSSESRTSDTRYSLVVALGLSKQNSRWGRWQGSQGHISILPHLSANLDLDIQKLPLHWWGPSSQLWLFLFPHSLSRIPALVNNVPWTHYKATVLKIPVYFEANISSWRSQFLSEISQREKDR